MRPKQPKQNADKVSPRQIWFVYLLAFLTSLATFAYMCVLAALIAVFVPTERANINYYAAMFYSRVMSWVLGLRWRVVNEAMREGAPRPCVFVANHQSSMDIVVMSRVMPRRCVLLLKASVRHLPFIGQYVALADNVFLQKGPRTMASLLDKMEKEKMCLWMYPEGIRSHSDTMLPFRRGAFRLAIERQLPICPVVISSFRNIFKRFKTFKGGLVTVKFLDPVPTTGLTRDDTDMLVEKVQALMANELEIINRST